MKGKPRQIAPLLQSGDSRVRFGARFPEEVKEGLRDIARHENRSMNWVLEETVIRFFRMDTPRYRKLLRKASRNGSKNGHKK